jgi:hypothetical protein
MAQNYHTDAEAADLAATLRAAIEYIARSVTFLARIQPQGSQAEPAVYNK